MPVVKRYLPRIADELLAFKLRAKGAVWVTGPKWCGKSTTAARQAKSKIFFQGGPEQEQNLTLAEQLPSRVLAGDTPRLLDEWQLAPSLWDSVRTEVDARNEVGQFILTGSTTPPKKDEDSRRHSGIGRIARLSMSTMSLFESEDSTGEVSLKELFSGPGQIAGECKVSLEEYAYFICRGGWPGALGMGRRESLEQAIDYFDNLINVDASRYDGVSRSPDRVRTFLQSYARLSTTQGDYTAIKRDMSEHEGVSLSDETIASYASVMRGLFITSELDAWNPILLKKDIIRKSPTRHFTDPSIACASLGIGPEDLINDFHAFGIFFESLAVRDLRIFASAMDGNVCHFRDRYGNETDVVIHLRNGTYGLVEVKLTSKRNIDEGAESLKRIASMIDPMRMKSPSFLAVVTTTGYAYRRPDGVYVVPLACLKP